MRHVQRTRMPEFVRGLPSTHRRDRSRFRGGCRRRTPGTICGASRPAATASCSVARCRASSWLTRAAKSCPTTFRGSTGASLPREFDEMSRHITGEELLDTGNDLRPGIALPLLWWLKRRGGLPEGDATPVSLADFVAGRLCGYHAPHGAHASRGLRRSLASGSAVARRGDRETRVGIAALARRVPCRLYRRHMVRSSLFCGRRRPAMRSCRRPPGASENFP